MIVLGNGYAHVSKQMNCLVEDIGAHKPNYPVPAIRTVAEWQQCVDNTTILLIREFKSYQDTYSDGITTSQDVATIVYMI